jgi:hypothetical protein
MILDLQARKLNYKSTFSIAFSICHQIQDYRLLHIMKIINIIFSVPMT